MSDTSTPLKAREHARAQAAEAAAKVRAKPTIPASSAKDLPAGVKSSDVLWDQIIPGGGYASRRLPRGSRLRITDLDGDACANVLIYNSDMPTERLNVADTVKVQWNAYLGKGKLLLSDMGRVLMSILDDTSESHDAFCGASNAKTNLAKYGQGDNHTPCPSARERFILALLKHGLNRSDVMPNVNFFKGVTIDLDGRIHFVQSPAKPGAFVELRAEMNVLVVIANTPHVLDPRSTYACSPLRLTAWKSDVAGVDDPIRHSAPEAERAFENVEEYFRGA